MRHHSLCFSLILLVSLFALPVSAAEEETPGVFYHEMNESFTINFARQSNDEARYLDIKVAIKTTERHVYQAIKTHQPLIEDQLRSLFADQDMQTVRPGNAATAIRNTGEITAEV